MSTQQSKQLDFRAKVQSSLSVEGRVVLITGAGSGIGRAAARTFAALGAKVSVTDINREAAEETGALCLSDGARQEDIITRPVNVTKPDELEDAFAQVNDVFGGLNVLVNNAGIFQAAALDADNYDEAWEISQAVMLTAKKNSIRAALPLLRLADHPRIINIASTEGLGATMHHSAYVTMKHGVIGLTRALALDLGKEGITVNCICPGAIHTGMTDQISEQDKERFAQRRTILRRYGQPEEIANLVLSLSLPGSSYVTGAVLVVDGGLTVRNA